MCTIAVERAMETRLDELSRLVSCDLAPSSGPIRSLDSVTEEDKTSLSLTAYAAALASCAFSLISDLARCPLATAAGESNN